MESEIVVYTLNIEACVTSEYPQDGGPICCCYDYRSDARLHNCVDRCVLSVIKCVLQKASTQDGDRGKKADGL